MSIKSLEPKKRSQLRIAIGKRYFTIKRFIYWCINSNSFVKESQSERLNHIIFEHKTPLRRNLKDVDQSLDENKIKNLKNAIKFIDGMLIKPDEVFSYWKRIGKPSGSRGFVDGMVLDHGKYKLGVGGGLCQLSNMLFWMVLHTPVDVIERHRHSYDVFPDSNRTQPFGSGATCVYNYRDLQFINRTNEIYQIKLRLDGDYLYGEILSNKPKYFNYEVYESSHSITQEYWGGYIRHNSINSRVYNLEKKELYNKTICENHAIMMYSPLLNPPTSFDTE